MCLENELEIFGEQQALGSLEGASASFSPLCLYLGGLTYVLVGQGNLHMLPSLNSNSAFFQS